jgi:hypothetical protein
MRTLQRLVLAAMAGAAIAVPAPGVLAHSHVYGTVESRADLDHIFARIREETAGARTRAELTRLYRRARYLVTLTRSRSWRARFGPDAPAMQAEARRQFRTTVEAINRHARTIGTDADYDDSV